MSSILISSLQTNQLLLYTLPLNYSLIIFVSNEFGEIWVVHRIHPPIPNSPFHDFFLSQITGSSWAKDQYFQKNIAK